MTEEAYEQLIEYLREDEVIEAIQFGEWGWGGYKEPEPNPIPHELFGKILTLESAEPYMRGWSIYGGFGSPECYSLNAYTNHRVIWITQYDGATGLDSMPRHPKGGNLPYMPGA